jgi:2-octaprenylphenol hydroxylase
MQSRTHDVIVIGAGMVGATAACLLARAGFSVAIVEASKPPLFQADEPVGLRVSAISNGSEAILREAGGWRKVEQGRHCVYRRMKVEDRDSRAVLEFNSAEFGMNALGTIVENDLLQWSLWQCLENLGGVELICPAEVKGVDLEKDTPTVKLASGESLKARLIVGADGPSSLVRQAMGIDEQFWSYGQQGIVAVVETAEPNNGLAWQRFISGGPVAFLPLSDGSSSIVWSQPDARVKHLLSLDEDAFCNELTAATIDQSDSTGVFGGVIGSGPRAAFPLTMQLADTYTSGPAVLIGDAAHVVHPMAGQGVNLGFADAAALAETLILGRKAGEQIASEKILGNYARWRKSEAEMMARGIHGMRSVFTPDMLAPLRRLGLGLVSNSWTMKEAFIRRATGSNRNAPALSKGVGLSELMH